ncbi:uncharacterized protein LOC120328386 [Styela clava]
MAQKFRKTILYVNRGCTKPEPKKVDDDTSSGSYSETVIDESKQQDADRKKGERRMSYWDRFMAESNDKFANFPQKRRETKEEDIKAVVATEQNVVFQSSPRDITTNIQSNCNGPPKIPEISESSSEIAADYLRGIPRLSTRHNKKKFGVLADCHEQSCQTDNESNTKKNSTNFACKLRERHKNVNLLGQVRPIPVKYLPTEQNAESNIRRTEKDIIQIGGVREEKRPIFIKNIISSLNKKTSSTSSSSGQTGDSKSNFRVVFRSTTPDMPRRINECYDIDSEQSTRTVKVGRGRRVTFPSTPVYPPECREKDMNQRPLIKTAGSVLNFLQGFPAVRIPNQVPRVYKVANNSKDCENPPRIQLGRTRNCMRREPFPSVSRRPPESDTSIDSVNQPCIDNRYRLQIKNKHFEDSESNVAFSSDEDHPNNDRTATSPFSFIHKYSQELLTRYMNAKSKDSKKRQNKIHPYSSSVLSCVFENQGFNILLRSICSACDIVLRIIALLILFYYAQKDVYQFDGNVPT